MSMNIIQSEQLHILVKDVGIKLYALHRGYMGQPFLHPLTTFNDAGAKLSSMQIFNTAAEAQSVAKSLEFSGHPDFQDLKVWSAGVSVNAFGPVAPK